MSYTIPENRRSHFREQEINDIIVGKAIDTFVISFIICFIAIFGGLVLAIYLVRILVEKNLI